MFAEQDVDFGDKFNGNKILKGYELQERIGAGGFGAVYKAYQSTVGREVAIKIILPRYANHPDFIRRFETEAQTIARLEHMHIIPLYDYWRDPDGAYLVMRWLRGGSLKDTLRKDGAFDLRAAAMLLDQVASALAVAHRNEIIHRDLKPGNILLDEDGNAYLADFGIAKDLSMVDEQTGDIILGSPDYISPEQARSERATPATDIYTLGVVLYEVLAGQHPFPNISPVERMYKHLNEPIPEISWLDNEMNAVIQKATAKNPAHRYADVLELAQAFREAVKLTPGDSIVEQLTRREQEVLQGIIDGLSNKEIANALFITLSTVKWYVKQIYKKLGVRSRVQAIVRARELNLIVPTSGDQRDEVDSTVIYLHNTGLIEPENPYKGLQAFSPADSRDFHGREKLIEKLLKHISDAEDGRFVAVIGPSGSGKSSLVKAGLIPALWRGDLPGSEQWFVVDMLPGSHPIDELEIALTRVAADQAENLASHLSRDERGLIRAGQLILPDDDSQLVLIIDQFEEVFTMMAEEGQRAHFLDLLHSAATDPRSRVRIVITLRADFYDRPLHYPNFGNLVRNNLVTVLPLSADGLEKAILKPAERVGIRFEDGLVPTIASEISYQPGALPLLQYALTELFERREGRKITFSAFQEIGGTVGALAKRADEIYLEQDASGQEVIRQLFLRLVTLGEGTEDTRRRASHEELMAVGDKEDMMEEMINAYADFRLLSLDNDPETRSPTVEVAHEAILREWERLRQWLHESREDIRLQQLLNEDASKWAEAEKDPSYLLQGSRLKQYEQWAAETDIKLSGREQHYLEASITYRSEREAAEAERSAREARLEKRSQRLMRWGIAGLIIFDLILGALVFYSMGLKNEAEHQRDLAEENAALAQMARAAAERAASLAEERLALSIAGNASSSTFSAPTLGMALAYEAMQINPEPFNVQNAFFNSLSENPYIAEYDFAVSVTAAAYDENNALLYVATSLDNHIHITDTSTNETTGDLDLNTIINIQTTPPTISEMLLSPDGNTLYVQLAVGGLRYNRLYAIDLESQSLRYAFRAVQQVPVDTDLSQDGALLATADSTMVHLWDTTTGALLWQQAFNTAPTTIQFSPDGRSLFVATVAGTIQMVDIESKILLKTFQADEQAITAFDISPNGAHLFVGNAGGTLYLWDIGSGARLATFADKHESAVNAVAYHPDGRSALTAANETITWNMERQETISEWGEMWPDHHLIVYSASGQMALITEASRVYFLDTMRHIPAEEYAGGSVASLDGRYILSGLYLDSRSNPRLPALIYEFDDTRLRLQLNDTVSGDVWVFELPPGEVPYSATFAPDNQSLVLASMQASTIELQYRPLLLQYDGNEWQLVEGEWGYEYINSIAISADNRYIYLASNSQSDYAIGIDEIAAQPDDELWTLGNFAILPSPEGFGIAGAFSPDGSLLATVEFDSYDIVLVSRQGLVEGKRFSGHTSRIIDLFFSPNGQLLLSLGADGRILGWHIETGEVLFDEQNSGVRVLSRGIDEALTSIALGENTGNVYYVQIGPNLILHTYTLPNEAITGIYFLPQRQQIMIVQSDYTSIFDLPPYQNVDEAMLWARTNRAMRRLTCKDRLTYGVTPLCDENGDLPPLENGQGGNADVAAATASTSPDMLNIEGSATPFAPTATAIIPSPTPTATATATATPMPELRGELQIGQPITGVLSGTAHRYSYAGQAGQSLAINLNATRIAVSISSASGDFVARLGAGRSVVTVPDTDTYYFTVDFDPNPGFYSLTVEDVVD